MNLGVVGSRKNVTKEIVYSVLDNFKDRMEIEMIISGGAQGTDSFAASWASENKIELLVYFPDWNSFGKSAGARRNQQIVDTSDQIILFWDGKSKGTEITMGMARKARKPFHLIFSGERPVNSF